MSATTQGNLSAGLSAPKDLPKTNVAYVLYGQGQALPEQYVYSVVDRPFTNETMMQGISDALASLRSDR